MDYELHSLGWRAFQDLCVIIMQEIWGHTVQSFCDTHDGGRDGAFYGSWSNKGKMLEGAFTAQCKFSAEPSKNIKLSELKTEIEKAKRLANKGLSGIYVLFTNAKLTGQTEEKLKSAFEAIDGIDTFIAFGRERISLEIQQSPRLRMLVPRVYGLGDLSLIMDERACQQASSILGALGDDLNKFVRTSVFHRSAKALIDHGFVLLLGEPACGKSTIAAALAVGAIDDWGCSTVKITNASEFTNHWNPNEPKRLYWVDDAFGATQMDYASTINWNYVFPQIYTAIKLGAKVIFTSRDYIYRSAKQYIKETALPIVKTSQVIINVQDISIHEREQILYNHIKLGTQCTKFKKKIKPYLHDVAENEYFTPELARRLGNPIFTTKLDVSSAGVCDYIENPLDFLLDVIVTLDRDSLSALAIIFMKGGAISSPIETTTKEEEAIAMIGGSLAGVRSALNAMNNSLVVQLREDDQYVWRYKHPTIRDAFAQHVSDNMELLDIYLLGSPLATIVREISCGIDGLEGVKIILPVSKYPILIRRLKNFDTSSWQAKAAFTRFMATRCDRTFLEQYIFEDKCYLSNLRVIASFFLGSDIDVVLKLNSFNLLPEMHRKKLVKDISDNAVEEYDPDFLSSENREFLTEVEFNDIRERVFSEVISDFEGVVDNICSNFDLGWGSPEDHFDNLASAIRAYKLEFNDDEASQLLTEGESFIESTIDELGGRGYVYNGNQTSSYESHQTQSISSERSIFDDVDL